MTLPTQFGPPRIRTRMPLLLNWYPPHINQQQEAQIRMVTMKKKSMTHLSLQVLGLRFTGIPKMTHTWASNQRVTKDNEVLQSLTELQCTTATTLCISFWRCRTRWQRLLMTKHTTCQSTQSTKGMARSSVDTQTIGKMGIGETGRGLTGARMKKTNCQLKSGALSL